MITFIAFAVGIAIGLMLRTVVHRKQIVSDVLRLRSESGISFADLRRANVERLPLFKNSRGESANHLPDGSDWSESQWFKALVGEVGEYGNLSKKHDRGDISDEEFYREAARELADIQTYLDILSFRIGIDLGQATAEKFNEVSAKMKIDVRL